MKATMLSLVSLNKYPELQQHDIHTQPIAFAIPGGYDIYTYCKGNVNAKRKEYSRKYNFLLKGKQGQQQRKRYTNFAKEHVI